MEIDCQLVPAVQMSDIEEFLQLKGIDLDDATNFFFGDDYMNDCYKALYIAEDADPRWNDQAELCNKIYELLRKAFPEYDTILIDVSW